ncbi:DNA-binding death effector domain-containing protein 2 [Cuculus canorus]|uniref:DNA-binding death effector domain-containing protein 2 n=1 Tax=Cuculus canorus TaxID=55661 RepID=UPI0023AAD4B5|nr:DNA-binding death effector domain-containing protein 2 [Cuculus canorus]
MSRVPWEEEECLDYYGMVSLHRLFEVVGSQLTPSDVAVLSFLLDESPPAPHPLDPALWGGEGSASPQLLERWNRRRRRLHRHHHHHHHHHHQRAEDEERLRPPPAPPRDGVELLLELERRGLCDEGNVRHLLQLLRVLTRHDLLHCVSFKRPRTVSPERFTCGPAVVGSCLSAGAPQPRQENWETGSSSGKRKRSSRRSRRSSSSRSSSRSSRTPLAPRRPPPEPPAKVTCDIRLRVRAEYCDHDSALRRSVASSRPRGPGRQLDVFGQASGILKSRDLGSILCDIKFSELSYLDAFWGDYLNGALLEALKGVFLTEGLRRAVGREAVRLLVSVDQDDYEEGRKLLLRAAQRNQTSP